MSLVAAFPLPLHGSGSPVPPPFSPLLPPLLPHPTPSPAPQIQRVSKQRNGVENLVSQSY